MLKNLLIIASMSTAANAVASWKKGKCPKPETIKTELNEEDKLSFGGRAMGSWMTIADDKQMIKSINCPGIRLDPIGEKELTFAKSFSYTKDYKDKLI